MLTPLDFRRILARIQLKSEPTWLIELRYDEKRPYLQVQDPAGTCNITGKPMPWHARKWMLSPHMTETEVVTTAFKAYMAAIEHEAREGFLYREQSIFDPHISVEDLFRLRATRPLDGRD